MSGFGFELMAAADAGDIPFAGAALHAQEDLAVGALKVFIVLAVLQALDELAGLEFPVGGQFDILTVLGNPFIVIAGEHTEDGPDIGRKTYEGEQTDAGKAAKQRADETGNQGEHAEIVGAMAADHETGKRLTETLEKVHGKAPFRNGLPLRRQIK